MIASTDQEKADCPGCCAADLCPPELATITAVASGVNVDCCFVSGSNSVQVSGSPVGGDVYPQSGITWLGSNILDPALIGTIYSGTSCGGPQIGLTDPLRYDIEIDCNGTEWAIRVTLLGSLLFLFHATGTGGLPHGVAINNALLSCSDGGTGYGGTITLAW